MLVSVKKENMLLIPLIMRFKKNKNKKEEKLVRRMLIMENQNWIDYYFR